MRCTVRCAALMGETVGQEVGVRSRAALDLRPRGSLLDTPTTAPRSPRALYERRVPCARSLRAAGAMCPFKVAYRRSRTGVREVDVSDIHARRWQMEPSEALEVPGQPRRSHIDQVRPRRQNGVRL